MTLTEQVAKSIIKKLLKGEDYIIENTQCQSPPLYIFLIIVLRNHLLTN